jgi:hypothetical protein
VKCLPGSGWSRLLFCLRRKLLNQSGEHPRIKLIHPNLTHHIKLDQQIRLQLHIKLDQHTRVDQQIKLNIQSTYKVQEKTVRMYRFPALFPLSGQTDSFHGTAFSKAAVPRVQMLPMQTAREIGRKLLML